MKGQNLRIVINNKCIAASRECTWHQSVELEDISTNDTDEEFSKQSISSRSWDASSNGLFVDMREQYIVGSDFEDIADYSWQLRNYHFGIGDSIILVSSTPVTFVVGDMDHNVIASGTGEHIRLTINTASEDYYLGISSEELWQRVKALYRIPNGEAADFNDLLNAYLDETPISVKLSATKGQQNREVESDITLSSGIITDLQIVSTNKQHVTCSIQIQGCDGVELGEDNVEELQIEDDTPEEEDENPSFDPEVEN